MDDRRDRRARTTRSRPSTSRLALRRASRWSRDLVGRDPARARSPCIVGANACGKSTLLRGARPGCSSPQAGAVLLDGADHPPAADEGGGHTPRHPAAVADRARRASRSPTSSPAAATRTRSGSGSGRADDEEVGRPRAMAATDTLDLADRPVDELSGGQRQRVWIAMALAQEHRHHAARRADDVPRPRPPGRRARPARRPQPSATGARSCSCCTTSTRRAATATTSIAMKRRARSSPQGRRPRSSPRSWCATCSACAVTGRARPGRGDADGGADRPPRRQDPVSRLAPPSSGEIASRRAAAWSTIGAG